jgi:hypothetical protein
MAVSAVKRQVDDRRGCYPFRIGLRAEARLVISQTWPVLIVVQAVP